MAAWKEVPMTVDEERIRRILAAGLIAEDGTTTVLRGRLVAALREARDDGSRKQAEVDLEIWRQEKKSIEDRARAEERRLVLRDVLALLEKAGIDEDLLTAIGGIRSSATPTTPFPTGATWCKCLLLPHGDYDPERCPTHAAAIEEHVAEVRKARAEGAKEATDTACAIVEERAEYGEPGEKIAEAIRRESERSSAPHNPDPAISLIDHLRTAGVWEPGNLLESVKRLVEREREACAMLADDREHLWGSVYADNIALGIAARIRSRGDR